MPKLLCVFLFFFLSSRLAFGAVASTTEWDVRSTGSDANGGGFNVAASGVDRSQQDAPFITFTDLVIGGTTTQVTSALNPFGPTSPGNIINVVSGTGCTVQRAQVVSVTGVTATMDVSMGTAASVCTGNLGGALQTTVLGTSLMVNANVLHIKTGTYSNTVENTIAPANATVIGFGTTHRDGGTRPLITTATNSVDIFGTSSANGIYTLQNLSMSSTAAVRGDGIQANGVLQATLYVIGCVMDGFRYAIEGSSFVNWRYGPIYVSRSEFKNNTNAILTDVGGIYIYGSSFHGNTTAASTTPGSGQLVSVSNSLFYGNGYGVGGSSGGLLLLYNNTFADNTGSGVNGNGSAFISFTNNIFYGNGTYGIENGGNAVIARVAYNSAYGSNGTANIRSDITSDTSTNVTLTANPFTNSGAGDYSLNSTAGGGAATKAAGYPGTFVGGTTTGYLSIGTVQPQSGAASATIAYPTVQ